MNFFTADYHLGEERLEILGRPFETPEQCALAIASNNNKLVGKKDKIYVVGDVLYKNADPDKWLPYLKLMNGVKILVRGNHDAPFSDDIFKPYFDEIIPEGKGLELHGVRTTQVLAPTKIWVTHYPTQGKKDYFNLVGHIHGAWKVQLNMLNVGVDVHHFYPMPEEKIQFYYNAICKFYDEDAWVAYHHLNSDYQSSRGQKSRYFNESA